MIMDVSENLKLHAKSLTVHSFTLSSQHMNSRVPPPQKKKFCDRLELMGEVIIKWFYFYYFRFRQLFERALLKNHNHKFFSMKCSQQGMPLKIILKNSRIFWLEQNMKNDVNTQEMLCNKISKNPRFFFCNFLRHSLLTALHGVRFSTPQPVVVFSYVSKLNSNFQI